MNSGRRHFLTLGAAGLLAREVVEERIGQRDAMIVDVRSEAEFAGQHFWPSGATEDAGRAGHIPSAVHVPADLVHDEEGALRSPTDLRAVFETSVGSDRRVLTYCTIGNRASQVWFALKYVHGQGDVSGYYGTWAEWGKLASTPSEIASPSHAPRDRLSAIPIPIRPVLIAAKIRNRPGWGTSDMARAIGRIVPR